MFSREYCKIFKDTYFEKHLRTAASETQLVNTKLVIKILFCKNIEALSFSQRSYSFIKTSVQQSKNKKESGKR